MPSCNTYHLTWVSLTLDEGYLLTTAPPDLERGIAPLGPPAPGQPLLLGLSLCQTFPNLPPLTCLASNLSGGVTHSPPLTTALPAHPEDPPPLSGEEGLRARETHCLVSLPVDHLSQP